MSAPNDIVLWHYPFSPYARRIIWYLALRKIPYAQCIQPPMLPRPDLEALGVKYRRIPLLSIGADMYCDTRLILRKLEEQFPASSQYTAISSPETAAMAALLSKFTNDTGVFVHSAGMIPLDFPIMKDEKFLRDREALQNRSWKLEDIARQRPEAIAHMRMAFDLVESLLADGREWIAGTRYVDRADIECVWPFHWVLDLSPPAEFFSKDIYPRTYAYIARFKNALKAAESTAPKPTTLKGPDAVNFVKSASFADSNAIVEKDPLGLAANAQVQVWPIDSGFTHKDTGSLVKLTKDEVAVAVKTGDGKSEVRVHAPRWGFRVREVGETGKL